VGVRDLKQHLSSYLERAANGERITVTDRGQPKAVLGPVPGGDNIARGIAEGWITPAAEPGPLGPPPQRFKATMTVQEMMDEDRGDD
jgi:prevent-host-death family protein